MISCIIINKNDIEEIRVKNLTESIIYKKCNYKIDKDFDKIFSWNNGENIIELWGKNTGKNKNDYSIFKDNNLNVYGKSIFLQKNNENFISLSKDDFIKFFNVNKEEEDFKEKTKTVEVEVEEQVEAEAEAEAEAEEEVEAEAEAEAEAEEEDNEDNISEYSYNSELTPELYCYTDEES